MIKLPRAPWRCPSGHWARAWGRGVEIALLEVVFGIGLVLLGVILTRLALLDPSQKGVGVPLVTGGSWVSFQAVGWLSLVAGLTGGGLSLWGSTRQLRRERCACSKCLFVLWQIWGLTGLGGRQLRVLLTTLGAAHGASRLVGIDRGTQDRSRATICDTETQLLDLILPSGSTVLQIGAPLAERLEVTCRRLEVPVVVVAPLETLTGEVAITLVGKISAADAIACAQGITERG